MTKKNVYKVIFHNQGKLYELYARHVTQGNMYGFIEVGDIIFGERSALLVDPAEERLKAEFSGVKYTYIPIYAVVRIDEVEQEGINKIVSTTESGSNITPFPIPLFKPPSGDSGSS
jgi:hypothetical protein